MSEKERRSFGTAYAFYEKWRDQIIETDEQWDQFAKDVGKLSIDLDVDHNPIGRNLFHGLLETFNELYKDGKKPMPDNYFGRNDL